MLVAPDVWLSFLTKKLPQDQKDQSNLVIYGCLAVVSLMFILTRTYVLLSCFLRCSERLHDKMVVATLQAPVLFFDSNSVGRILNRFSKDIGWLDEQLPRKFQLAIDSTLNMLASLIVPAVMNPWLIFILIPLISVALYLSTYYLKTSRELKRLASISRSPVFSHISETLDGLETIRTRERQSDFVDQFYRWVCLVLINFIQLASWLSTMDSQTWTTWYIEIKGRRHIVISINSYCKVIVFPSEQNGHPTSSARFPPISRVRSTLLPEKKREAGKEPTVISDRRCFWSPICSNDQKAMNNPLILSCSLAFLKTSWCSESSKHLGNGRWEMDQCAIWNSCILICWCSGFLSCYYVSRCRWVCITKRSQFLIRLSDRRRKKTQILTESHQI